ncbi:Cof-type HAD-IIB family hydrolase [Rummeliibacillus sp. JY-2-4R]
MSYKIIFFDVDGTLIDYNSGIISDTTKLAIQKLKDQKIHVVAATGRPLSMCQELISIGIDTFITANGAYVKNKNEVIYKTILDKHIVNDIHIFAQQNGQALSYFTEKLNMNGIYNDHTRLALQQTLSLTEYPELDKDILDKEIYLMCLYGNNKTINLYREIFPHLQFQQWHPYIANVLQTNISKSIAANSILNYFGYNSSEAIAFGDGENDIDLLQLTDLGVAMGNGNRKLKEIANFVTKDCAEDGVMYALKKFEII